MIFFRNTFFNALPGAAFIALFLCSVFAFGQQAKIDSLQKLLATDKEDTSRIKNMNKLSWTYIGIGQYGPAVKTATMAITLGKKVNYEKGLADSYNMLGNVYLRQGDLRGAEQNFLISMDIQKSRGDKKGMAAAYNNLALVYEYLGELGKALEDYSAAVKLNIETGNKSWLANNYNNIGTNYNTQGKRDKALENFLAAKKIKEEIGETKDYQYANTISNIGSMYFYKKELDKALGIFNTSLAIRKEIQDDSGIADSYVAIGSVYFEWAKTEQDPVKLEALYKKAGENMNAGLEIKEKIGDLYGLSLTLLDVGSLHLRQNKIDEARRELQRAVGISKENHMNELSKDIYRTLAACDSVAGNWQGAYNYQKLYKQYNDSIFNEENSKKIAEMNTRFETEKKRGADHSTGKRKKTHLAVCKHFYYPGAGAFILCQTRLQ